MGTLLMMMGWLLSDMPPAAVDVARQLYVEATQSYQAGDWAGGVERLERAYVLVRKPVILFNIAFGYVRLSNPFHPIITGRSA